MKVLTLAVALLATLSMTTAAVAQTPSGLMLGIYAQSSVSGLRVNGTIPGYTAEGRLQRGDRLQRVTADGISIYPTRSIGQMEIAKDRIGPNRLAEIEVFRPGVGLMSVWVEFVPLGVPTATATHQARIYTQQERPNARSFFRPQHGQPRPELTPPGVRPAPPSRPLPPARPGLPGGPDQERRSFFGR